MALNELGLTKREVAEFLENKIDSAFGEGCCCVSYIDTVQILMKSGIWKDLFRDLKASCGSLVPQKSQCLKYPYLVRIHQPQVTALQFLLEAREPILVNRVDVAFDFETKQARMLTRFLRMYLTQPWRGDNVVREVDETTYFRPANAGRNIAIYPARSKYNLKPCTHLEIRVTGAGNCRKYGLGSLSNLRFLGDAGAIQLLGRSCRFTAMHPRSIQKSLVELESRQMQAHSQSGRTIGRPEARQLLNRRLSALLQDSWSRPDMARPWNAPAQHWLDYYPEVARRAAVQVPWAYAVANKDIEFGFCPPRDC